MSETMILIKDFRKSYGGFIAVDGISLDVSRGEVFGLLGPNGAGKTTTLECLEGLRRSDGGTLRVDDVDPGRVGRRLSRLIGDNSRLRPCRTACAWTRQCASSARTTGLHRASI
ncbi:ATP-binding cassette domain-containing protein [Cryobacterium gelidum]|uniref:ATP-binding cassette domain-containing protein n=1 Tax=Cryobacterium gelidum TaxID=1259164 RepID=UPI00141AB923|nr:ATP-binding cassette domain-containing protein [Cryobacterium gelidum]